MRTLNIPVTLHTFWHSFAVNAVLHGLRATELALARRTQLKLQEARFVVHRLKGSRSGEHPVSGSMLRAVRAYLRTRTDALL